MSGTEFLVQARQVFPDARKVLLTAYADTEVAINGINLVQLDHYLMKPWDPPAERLYPVLDDLLSDWSASFRPPFEGIRVAGSLRSPKSHDVKDFLSRSQDLGRSRQQPPGSTSSCLPSKASSRWIARPLRGRRMSARASPTR